MEQIIKQKLFQFFNEYETISEQIFNEIEPYFFLKELTVKDKLIDEGQLEENVYLVIKGIFRKYIRNGRSEIITHFYKEGDLCHSAVSFYSGIASPYIIEALEPSSCIGIHRNDFDMLIKRYPILNIILSKVMIALYIKKDVQEMTRMKLSKKEFFNDFFQNNAALLQRVPQKYLASYLQIAPETFCRMKRSLYNSSGFSSTISSEKAA
jgi:CRP-like cAMP-binding protein